MHSTNSTRYRIFCVRTFETVAAVRCCQQFQSLLLRFFLTTLFPIPDQAPISHVLCAEGNSWRHCFPSGMQLLFLRPSPKKTLMLRKQPTLSVPSYQCAGTTKSALDVALISALIPPFPNVPGPLTPIVTVGPPYSPPAPHPIHPRMRRKTKFALI